MPESPLTDLKTCPYCGKQTSTQANFCYYCARELVARPERPAETPRPFPTRALLLGMAVLVVAALLIWLILR
jgi:predicted amidophosphoribosyltransferase